MNRETTFQNYQAFSRIIDMMSLMDRVHELTPNEVRESVSEICSFPENPRQEVSMEEVVFWAGVATGMEVCRNFEEGSIDAEAAEKFMTYSSLFAYSTQSAVVDLTLQNLEGPK